MLRALVCAALLTLPAFAGDLVPLGPAKILNTNLNYDQKQPWVDADDEGNFTLAYAWYNIYGRRFDRDGNPLGNDFQVNPTINNSWQDECYVGVDPISGDFAIAWSDRNGNDGFLMGCGIRFYRADGTPYGPEFLCNVTWQDSQFEPYLAYSPTGTVFVAWTDTHVDGSAGCVGRLFSRDGTPLTGEVLINEPSSKSQINPAVAVDRAGNFLVIYDDASGATGEPREVLGRFIAPNGVPIGQSFVVNSDSTGYQSDSSVDMAANGDFAVCWLDSSGTDGDKLGVMARLFFADGTPKGPQFVISTATAGDQYDPHVAVDFIGNPTFIWQDRSGGDWDVKMRRFDRHGNPLSGEILVHPASADPQTWAKVAVSHNGQRVMTAWYEDAADDVHGRFFKLEMITPSGPLVAGGQTQLALDLPGVGGEPYLLLASLGTAPGIPVGDGRDLHLALDVLFQYVLAFPNTPLLQGSAGVLGPNGEAVATMTLPPNPGIIGLDISFAAVTLANQNVGTMTDPLTLTVQ